MASSTRKVTLKSSDGKLFEVDESVALQSQLIKKRMIDYQLGESTFSFPTIIGSILSKAIDYCNKCAKMNMAIDSPDFKKWEADFVREVDRNTLYDLIKAASCLGIKDLLDLLCTVVEEEDADEAVGGP